ncbi:MULTISPECIES: hypothetical protein [unclassified Streptomyces]|uniref:hypothetical protein n=1 Tax=unclassified Streptomyces TaxID=2593676 RepID=UPI002E180087|nr:MULTISPECIES: hypothetical protein [unclassified Streptomyces]
MPTCPGCPEGFSGEVRHANTYRGPDELRGNRVLVVGPGASGLDLACSRSRGGRRSAPHRAVCPAGPRSDSGRWCGSRTRAAEWVASSRIGSGAGCPRRSVCPGRGWRRCPERCL